MHLLINSLKNISSRYAPSRVLSFNSAHVLKTLQLIKDERHVSRSRLIKELGLGEGSVKTLVKHLKMQKMISTNNRGTVMSEKGERMLQEICNYICSETNIPQCSISIGRFNHAILLRNTRFAIKNGLEQRDMAIKAGAKGATTLIFIDEKFMIAGTDFDSLEEEQEIEMMLKEKLKPKEDDIVLIGSDDDSYTVAEIATKAAALFTLENHDKHCNIEYNFG